MSQRKSIISQDVAPGSPLRRSSRISTSSPVPTAAKPVGVTAPVSRRRSSATTVEIATPAKIVRSKRLSLSQETTEVKTDVTKRSAVKSRAGSKSPTTLAADTKAPGTPSRRGRRPSISKIVEEAAETTRPASPAVGSIAGRRRSSRGQSTSPTNEPKEPAKPRGRRVSVTEKSSLEPIEEAVATPRKRGTPSLSSTTETDEKEHKFNLKPLSITLTTLEEEQKIEEKSDEKLKLDSVVELINLEETNNKSLTRSIKELQKKVSPAKNSSTTPEKKADQEKSTTPVKETNIEFDKPESPIIGRKSSKSLSKVSPHNKSFASEATNEEEVLEETVLATRKSLKKSFDEEDNSGRLTPKKSDAKDVEQEDSSGRRKSGRLVSPKKTEELVSPKKFDVEEKEVAGATPKRPNVEKESKSEKKLTLKKSSVENLNDEDTDDSLEKSISGKKLKGDDKESKENFSSKRKSRRSAASEESKVEEDSAEKSKTGKNLKNEDEDMASDEESKEKILSKRKFRRSAASEESKVEEDSAEKSKSGKKLNDEESKENLSLLERFSLIKSRRSATSEETKLEEDSKSGKKIKKSEKEEDIVTDTESKENLSSKRKSRRSATFEETKVEEESTEKSKSRKSLKKSEDADMVSDEESKENLSSKRKSRRSATSEETKLEEDSKSGKKIKKSEKEEDVVTDTESKENLSSKRKSRRSATFEETKVEEESTEKSKSRKSLKKSEDEDMVIDEESKENLSSKRKSRRSEKLEETKLEEDGKSGENLKKSKDVGSDAESQENLPSKRISRRTITSKETVEEDSTENIKSGKELKKPDDEDLDISNKRKSIKSDVEKVERTEKNKSDKLQSQNISAVECEENLSSKRNSGKISPRKSHIDEEESARIANSDDEETKENLSIRRKSRRSVTPMKPNVEEKEISVDEETKEILSSRIVSPKKSVDEKEGTKKSDVEEIDITKRQSGRLSLKKSSEEKSESIEEEIAEIVAKELKSIKKDFEEKRKSKSNEDVSVKELNKSVVTEEPMKIDTESSAIADEEDEPMYEDISLVVEESITENISPKKKKRNSLSDSANHQTPTKSPKRLSVSLVDIKTTPKKPLEESNFKSPKAPISKKSDNLLVNELEMTDGSDGSFHLNLSLPTSINSQENEEKLNLSGGSNSSDKENSEIATKKINTNLMVLSVQHEINTSTPKIDEVKNKSNLEQTFQEESDEEEHFNSPVKKLKKTKEQIDDEKVSELVDSFVDELQEESTAEEKGENGDAKNISKDEEVSRPSSRRSSRKAENLYNSFVDELNDDDVSLKAKDSRKSLDKEVTKKSEKGDSSPKNTEKVEDLLNSFVDELNDEDDKKSRKSICKDKTIDLTNTKDEINKQMTQPDKKKIRPIEISNHDSDSDLLDSELDDLITKKTEDYDDSEEDEETERNEYIDDMAMEGEEDTPSEGSNDIIDDGESLHSSESDYDDDSDDEYEGSFIATDESCIELLPGDEFDLGITKKTKKKKKSRIISIEDSSDEETEVIKDSPKVIDPPIVKNLPIKNSPIDIKDSPIVTDSPTVHESPIVDEVFVSDSDDVVEVISPTKIKIIQDIKVPIVNKQDDLASLENIQLKQPEHLSVKTPNNSLIESPNVKKRKSKRKSSISIQENLSLDSIDKGEISDKISKAVNFFCSSLRDKTGNVSLNVSLDYANQSNSSEDNDSKHSGDLFNTESVVNKVIPSTIDNKASPKRRSNTYNVSDNESSNTSEINKRKSSNDENELKTSESNSVKKKKQSPIKTSLIEESNSEKKKNRKSTNELSIEEAKNRSFNDFTVSNEECFVTSILNQESAKKKNRKSFTEMGEETKIAKNRNSSNNFIVEDAECIVSPRSHVESAKKKNRKSLTVNNDEELSKETKITKKRNSNSFTVSNEECMVSPRLCVEGAKKKNRKSFTATIEEPEISTTSEVTKSAKKNRKSNSFTVTNEDQEVFMNTPQLSAKKKQNLITTSNEDEELIFKETKSAKKKKRNSNSFTVTNEDQLENSPRLNEELKKARLSSSFTTIPKDKKDKRKQSLNKTIDSIITIDSEDSKMKKYRNSIDLNEWDVGDTEVVEETASFNSDKKSKKNKKKRLLQSEETSNETEIDISTDTKSKKKNKKKPVVDLNRTYETEADISIAEKHVEEEIVSNKKRNKRKLTTPSKTIIKMNEETVQNRKDALIQESQHVMNISYSKKRSKRRKLNPAETKLNYLPSGVFEALSPNPKASTSEVPPVKKLKKTTNILKKRKKVKLAPSHVFESTDWSVGVLSENNLPSKTSLQFTSKPVVLSDKIEIDANDFRNNMIFNSEKVKNRKKKVSSKY